jgi:hypothetical protein
LLRVYGYRNGCSMVLLHSSRTITLSQTKNKKNLQTSMQTEKQTQPIIPIKSAVPVTTCSSSSRSSFRACYTTPANYYSSKWQREKQQSKRKTQIKKATQLDAKIVVYGGGIVSFPTPMPCLHPSCSRVYARSMFPSRLFVPSPLLCGPLACCSSPRCHCFS